MTDLVFVDTNVLVYNRDASEPRKQKQASAWMQHLWSTRTGRLSFQVLHEFYVTVTAKLKPGLDPETARREVRLLFPWQPLAMDARIIEAAWAAQDRFNLSWWDALIVGAAQVADCRYLLTEDLQEAQQLGDLQVLHPFKSSPAVLV